MENTSDTGSITSSIQRERSGTGNSRPRVLMVDDDQSLLDGLRRLLRRKYAITAVNSPLDALALLETDTNYVAIVSDYHMPSMTGIDFLAAASNLAPDSARILLTGSSSLSTAVDAINVGNVFRFITKPIHGDDLETTLNAACDHYESTVGDRSELSTIRADREAENVAATRTVRQLEAVMDGGIRTVFQPILRLHDLAVVGHEALSRFDIEQDKSPETWFVEAEQHGLATDLDVAALRVAIGTWASTPMSLQPLWLNLSPATVTSGAANALLAKIKHPAMLEITERTPVENYRELRAALDPLRSAGLQLAIDDVGAGYSSMLHVTELRPDVIKLDRGLIADLRADADRRALVASLISFAAEREITSLAEGVETGTEAEILSELGVDLVQGYYFGRPAAEPLDRRVESAS